MSVKFTINGYTVGQWQACKRPLTINRTHELLRWRPQELLSACLRSAIFELSNGKSKEDVTATAVSHFLSVARNPGLDIYGIDTYVYAMDYCAIIRNFIEYLSRLPQLCLKEVQPLHLTNNIHWEFLSHRDEAGTLHRWKFVDYIEDDLSADLHSWEVFGDIAAADMPMQLHLVAIGKRDKQHQISPWCRMFAHPKLSHVYKFQKKSGKGLEGDWKPIWFASNSSYRAQDWVDWMLADNAVEGLIKHINVTEVAKEHIDLFYRDALEEGRAMAEAHFGKIPPRNLPMSRKACDRPFTCPHQLYCYNLKTDLDTVGIYQRRGES